MSKEKSPNKLQNDHSEMHYEHGVFHYPDDNITVVSQPSFEDTLEAIADQRSNNTMIITPELALLNDDEFHDFSPEKQTDAMLKTLNERFCRLKGVSYDTTNTIMMGAPLQSPTRTGFNNGAAVFQYGSTAHLQRKKHPGPYEESLGWFEYNADQNPYHRLGATGLICSELIFAISLERKVRDETEKVLMPAAWGVPSMTPEAAAQYGTVDEYNQYTLDRVASMAAEDLPKLKNIYIADRIVDGGVPQSGKIDIVRK